MGPSSAAPSSETFITLVLFRKSNTLRPDENLADPEVGKT